MHTCLWYVGHWFHVSFRGSCHEKMVKSQAKIDHSHQTCNGSLSPTLGVIGWSPETRYMNVWTYNQSLLFCSQLQHSLTQLSVDWIRFDCPLPERQLCHFSYEDASCVTATPLAGITSMALSLYCMGVTELSMLTPDGKCPENYNGSPWIVFLGAFPVLETGMPNKAQNVNLRKESAVPSHRFAYSP